MDWLSPIREIIAFALSFLERLPVIQAALGFVLMFFLPGFAWTLVFFGGRQINIIERLALSIGLSIALVTLSILAVNRLVGVRITGLNSALVILAITVVPLAWYCLQRFIRRRGGHAE